MIVRYLTNTLPHTNNGLATQFDANVIIREDNDTPEAILMFDINDYDCCYEELALADLVDNTDWKNDTSSFLLKKSLVSDVIELKLYKDCEFIADLNDNTLGIVFGNAYFGDNIRVGYQLNWQKVLIAFGTGTYYVIANREIINRNSTLKTHNFKLMFYNEFVADRTVSLKTISRGIIEGGIDYTGSNVNWIQQIRLKGIFHNSQKVFETDNFQDQQRNIVQIQDSISIDYDLELEGLPSNIAEPLLKDRLLANEFYITDYNLFNYQKYRNFSVYPKELIDQKFFNRTGNGLFSIKFTDKKKNIIKRNFL